MRTTLGAPDPGEFERRQPHNLFNDRRVGGRAKNRAVGESLYDPKKIAEIRKEKQKENQHKPSLSKPLYDPQMRERPKAPWHKDKW
jgi:hypothetical protein